MKKNSPELIIGILLLALPVALTIGCIVIPSIFWEGFVWKYFWGPIVSDAGGTDEVTSSYNWVDTLSYGLILAASVYYIHRLFQKLDLRVGLPFFIALSPVILLGPSLRVLEDMELFNEPLQYMFISPVIYILLGVLTLATLLFSLWIERRWPGGGKDQRRASALFLLFPGLVVSLLMVSAPSWLNGHPPFLLFIFISIIFSLFGLLSGRLKRYETILLIFWTEVILFVVVFYGWWLRGGKFFNNYIDVTGIEPEENIPGALAIVALMAVSLAVISVSLWLGSKRSQRLSEILNGVNLMILGGHMLDASATYVGIDHFGYIEKHKLPTILIEGTGTAAVMYPLKILFIVPALYLLDVVMVDEKRENVHMMALVKLTILILGFAPGSRDLLRLLLGV